MQFEVDLLKAFTKEVERSLSRIDSSLRLLNSRLDEMNSRIDLIVAKLEAQPLTKDWYSTAEFASAVGIKTDTVTQNYINKNRIPSNQTKKENGRWFIHRDAMEQAIRERKFLNGCW